MYIVKMISSLLFFTLFMGARYVVGDPSGEYVYSREADAWLRLHMEPASWSEAGMRCYLDGIVTLSRKRDLIVDGAYVVIQDDAIQTQHGGVLASPTTTEMANVMAAIMMEHKLTYSVFTGINSILERENFKSLDGIPLSYIPLSWAPGQPDNENSDEHCVVFNGGGALEDVSCESVLPYFCRKTSGHQCGANDYGYEWEPRTGSCYKFHRVAKTWRQALSTCHADGGYLAIINSETESTVLKELYEKNPKEVLIGANEHKHAFVGFLKYYDGQWFTINGETLSSTGFKVWDQSEPNDYDGMEACGSIHVNGLLNDASCRDLSPFICEINP